MLQVPIRLYIIARRSAPLWLPANKKFFLPILCKALHNVGKKNWLFAGSHQAAMRSAILYSLLGTCKLNNVNPFIWLRDVLQRIPQHPINKIDELLPNNWASTI